MKFSLSSIALLSSIYIQISNGLSFHGGRRDFMNQIVSPTATAAILTAFGGVPEGAIAEDDLMNPKVGGKIQYGDEKDLMSPKAHGTTSVPVQENLRYGVDRKTADKICSFNRHFAEFGGYFVKTSFEDELLAAKGPVTFYDSVSGKPLFRAPIGRSVQEFLDESEYHGWPSFRDEEVVWENVRILKGSGESVSVDGTHLGHNLPDRRGNRYVSLHFFISEYPFEIF